ncbi:MAG TPA: calcium-binding protein, partial [Nannocystis sp.]
RSSGFELTSLTALGLVSIELGYSNDRRCDARANCEVERASFVWRDGLGRERTGEVVDVHLACQ